MTEHKHNYKISDIFTTSDNYTMSNNFSIYPVNFYIDNEFNYESALGILLANEVVFLFKHLNTSSKGFGVAVNCSDTFMYASSDAEEVFYDELEDLFNHWKQDKQYGSIVWCIKKRNEMPLNPIVNIIEKMDIWDLQSMNLIPNFHENYLRNKE